MLSDDPGAVRRQRHAVASAGALHGGGAGGFAAADSGAGPDFASSSSRCSAGCSANFRPARSRRTLRARGVSGARDDARVGQARSLAVGRGHRGRRRSPGHAARGRLQRHRRLHRRDREAAHGFRDAAGPRSPDAGFRADPAGELARRARAGQLAVIAGDIDPSAIWARLLVWLSDRFYEGDHDLVVNTPSMWGARAGRAWSPQFAQGADGQPLHLFFGAGQRGSSLVAAFTGTGTPAGFEPLRKPTRPIARAALDRGTAAPRPVVFVLPGIMGSELADTAGSIWVALMSLLRGGLGRLRSGRPGSRHRPDQALLLGSDRAPRRDPRCRAVRVRLAHQHRRRGGSPCRACAISSRPRPSRAAGSVPGPLDGRPRGPRDDRAAPGSLARECARRRAAAS